VFLNFRRTVKDKQTGQNVVLSDKDFDFIQRLQSGKIPDADFDAFKVICQCLKLDWCKNLYQAKIICKILYYYTRSLGLIGSQRM